MACHMDALVGTGAEERRGVGTGLKRRRAEKRTAVKETMAPWAAVRQ